MEHMHEMDWPTLQLWLMAMKSWRDRNEGGSAGQDLRRVQSDELHRMEKFANAEWDRNPNVTFVLTTKESVNTLTLLGKDEL